MKNFLIGTALLIFAGATALVLKPIIAGTASAWIFIPIILIFVGGGFQAKAFFHAKKEMDALDKKFKALLK